MKAVSFLLAFTLLAAECRAQEKYVEREFTGNCDQIDQIARAYLKTRGFSEAECKGCPHSLKAPGALLDARGKVVGTFRMRSELTDFKPPFWLWSSPLHGVLHLSAKATPAGCTLGFMMIFGSFHTMVAGIFPVGEKLGVLSNGRLESEYLHAIQAERR
jgi:hypothetical protein